MPPSKATQSSESGKPANPVKHYHETRGSLAFGIWILSILVLGLAAAVVAKAPSGPLRSSASYNVAVASLQFILFFLTGSKPVSTTDARPYYHAGDLYTHLGRRFSGHVHLLQ
ncbi:hypothetical protein BDW67DRAFT_153658 [Aspergillus spinulosporus]